MAYNPEKQLFNLLAGNNNGALANTNGMANNGTSNNFFQKKWNSIENALGTTGAAIASKVYDDSENAKTAQLLTDNKARMNDIAKKYGFNDYHAVWDARDKAEAEGDTKTLDLIDNVINPQLQGQATENKNLATVKDDAYDDYRKNNYVSKKINQDEGKFLGSAINTLSTATDLLGLTNGPVSNAIQGGIEGIADELEQNGLRDFDLGRAGQNAISGAVTGAVVGKLNDGISNTLAKNGGNLFKGGNFVTEGLNKLGSSTALGRGASTLATGAARGAISGAVGGATGAGTSALLSGKEVIPSALQGAAQGLQSGAVTGAIMTPVNNVINKTGFMQSVNEAKQNWKDSGENFGERLQNTWDDSATNAAMNKVENFLLKHPLGNTIKDTADAVAEPIQTPTEQTATTMPTPKDTTAEWDAVAKEAGYKDLNDLAKKFVEANPNEDVTAQKILDWADNNPAEEKAAFTQAKTGKQIKNERAIVKELTDQFNPVDKPTVRATRPTETFSNLHNKLGLSDGDQIRQAVHYAEPGELVPTLIKESAGKAGVVDMTDAQTLVSDLKLNKRQNYTKTLNVLEDIIDSTPSSISGGKNGVDALQLQRTLEAMASDAMGTSGEYHIGNNVVDQTTAKNLMRIANSIGDNLDKAAVANGAVQATLNKYSNEIQAMRNAYPNNQKWQAMVDNEIAGAKTIKQLRSSIRDLTRASIYIKNGDDNASSFGGRFAQNNINVPTTKTGVTNKIINTAVDKVASSPLARNFRLNRYEKAVANGNAATGGNGDNGGTPTATAEIPSGGTPTPTPTATAGQTPNNYNPSTQIYNAIGRREGLTNAEQARTANYLTNAVQNNNNAASLESLVSPYNSTSVYDGVSQTATTANGNNGSYVQKTGDYWTDILGDALTSAINNNDVQAFATLYQMYIDSLSNLQSSSPSSTKLTDKQRQANAAQRALDDFETTQSNFGYDVSDIPILGAIANIGGNEYASKAEALALQVGYMLSGATVNSEEAKKIGMAYVPQPRDSEAVRQSKLQQLRGIISDYQQTYGA